MEKVQGSMEALGAMQVTEDTEGLDIQSKTLLQYAEILAVILRDTVAEFKGYSWKEVAEFIEVDSITSTTEVSPGRTNTKIRSDTQEYIHLNEKTALFDLAFRARNPQISTEDIQINLHIDVEPQKTYKTGYPIEKRGMYYLARRLSSQLSLAMKGTDYNQLAKCYSIWICRDDIPKKDRYSISVYEMVNTKNTAYHETPRENYDLMTLVVIKLGDMVYNGDKEDEAYELLRFLNAIMYPHKDSFMATVSEYIDYSDNETLWKGVTDVSTIEEIKYAGMREELREKLRKELTEKIRGELTEKIKRELTAKIMEGVREEGIQTMIQDNLEGQIPKERIIIKLQKRFDLTKEKAEEYYKKYAGNFA